MRISSQLKPMVSVSVADVSRTSDVSLTSWLAENMVDARFTIFSHVSNTGRTGPLR